jgi:hypothetical protein
MDDMTREGYWNEVECLAVGVTCEARERGRDIGDVLHETIDGHEWVIYTRRNLEVLRFTRNEDAAWDDGLVGDSASFCDTMAIAAYCAMRADVSEHEAFDAEDEDDECGGDE